MTNIGDKGLLGLARFFGNLVECFQPVKQPDLFAVRLEKILLCLSEFQPLAARIFDQQVSMLLRLRCHDDSASQLVRNNPACYRQNCSGDVK